MGSSEDHSSARWQTLLETFAPSHQSTVTINSSSIMDQTPRQRPLSLRISAAEAAAETSTSTQQATASASTSAPPGSISHALLRQLSRQNSSNAEPPISGLPSTAEVSATAAENAETHRLSSSATLDLHAFATWLEELFPYFIILGCIFVFYYHIGVFILCVLLRGVMWSNSTLRLLVALKKDLDLLEALSSMLWVMAFVTGVLWLAADQEFWRQLLLLPSKYQMTVWETLFTTAIVDTLVRLCTVIPKVMVLLAMHRRTVSRQGSRQQAHVLTFIEYLVTAYRTTLPAPVWYKYLVESAYTEHHVVSSLLTGAYLSLKLVAIVKVLGLVRASLKLMMRGGAAYGSYATKDEICEAGNMCAICQEHMDGAAKLECGHIFCESCIAEWLERDRTCPMCRAEVKPQGLQSFGDGSTPLLPFLF